PMFCAHVPFCRSIWPLAPAAVRGSLRLIGVTAVAWALFTLAPALFAQEPLPDADLDVALALECVMTQAIAKDERSVVEIARMRRASVKACTRGREGTRQLFLPAHRTVHTVPDFMPREYATEVVVDVAGVILGNYHELGDPDQSDYGV